MNNTEKIRGKNQRGQTVTQISSRLKMFKSKKIQTAMLIVVILIAIFFRFWQIRDYVVFLGDEGRDMIVMRNMFLQKRLTFLGPTASVGGFYLGPIYYWMAAPFLLLSRFDPVGPSYMVAILGVATVYLLFRFLKETVGFWPAILTSLLYSTAPLIVRYSRSSWNPNPLPFFALLMIYSLYLAISRKKYLFYVLAGACFGIAIQLHYLSAILLAIAAAIILINTAPKRWIVILLSIFVGAVITFSPFLIFEFKHNFPNFITIREFVTRGTTVGYHTYNLIDLLSNVGNILLEDITEFKSTIYTIVTFWVLTLGGIFGLITNWNNPQKKLVFSIGMIWFLGGLAGIRFYSGQVFDYYFGFIFPAPFFLAGLVFSLFQKNKYLKLLPVTVTIIATVYFLSHGFYRHSPNRLINQTETVADFVIEKSQGQPFNFAFITDHNSDHAYRYFLDIKGHKPTELETLITDQLIVVCETRKCAPLGYPSWEIAGFGRGEIQDQWELPEIGIKVFRLTHWPGEPSPAGKPAIKGG